MKIKRFYKYKRTNERVKALFMDFLFFYCGKLKIEKSVFHTYWNPNKHITNEWENDEMKSIKNIYIYVFGFGVCLIFMLRKIKFYNNEKRTFSVDFFKFI